MANEKQLKEAKKVYETLCAALDANDWKYKKHDDDLVITFLTRGDDIPMQFIVAIDADRQLVRMLSPLPFKFVEEKRVEAAVALCQTNYSLVDGSFELDLSDGEVSFKLTSSFKDCLISADLLNFMVVYACFVVDKYNDSLLMLNTGKISLDEYFEKI